MQSLYLILIAIIGTGVSYAAPLECNDQSYQCCWVIRSYQLVNPNDPAVWQQHSYKFRYPDGCCHIKGVICRYDPSINGTIKVDKIEWNDRKLKGSIPAKELSQLPNLIKLELGDNELSGTIPEELGDISSLVYLNLRNNNELKGTVPQSIGDLTQKKLAYINLGRNWWFRDSKRRNEKLSGTLIVYPNSGTGKFPRVIVDNISVKVQEKECLNDCCKAVSIMKDLEHEDYKDAIGDSNSDSTVDSAICCGNFGITCEGSSITQISWPSKGLKGSIPDTFNDLKKLKLLNLSSNDLTGGFPDYLPKTSITVLDLSRNNLSGAPDASYLSKPWDLQIGYQNP